jgi:RNA 3'-terminal phosphate cyclase (ATP)
MIEINGSQGEGGGQVLRTSLALSILTGQPMKITHIRAGRSKPGLLAQHLKAVDAAAAISKAHVEGAAPGSTSIVFAPKEIRSGRYKLDIGTAGSACLVLQTIFLPLSMANSASTVIITGGTHVPHAPCFHYLDLQWLPVLRRVGFNAQISLDQAGFYPKGGGRIMATIRPTGKISPLLALHRGPLQGIQGLSMVANLEMSIAERQKRQTLKRLDGLHLPGKIKTGQLPSPYKGTLLLLLAEFGQNREIREYSISQCCYYGLGELGKPAEKVADEAVDGLEAFLKTEGTVDQYLADQLLLPLAFAPGPSEIFTCQVTRHLVTNAEIIEAFLPVKIEISGEVSKPGLIRILPNNNSKR